MLKGGTGLPRDHPPPTSSTRALALSLPHTEREGLAQFLSQPITLHSWESGDGYIGPGFSLHKNNQGSLGRGIFHRGCLPGGLCFPEPPGMRGPPDLSRKEPLGHFWEKLLFRFLLKAQAWGIPGRRWPRADFLPKTATSQWQWPPQTPGPPWWKKSNSCHRYPKEVMQGGGCQKLDHQEIALDSCPPPPTVGTPAP
jgi:hypothetical protein